MRLFAMWLLDLNDFAERFLCYSTNLGVWCERSPVPSIPDVFEYAKCQALHIYEHAKSDTGAETRCSIQHCAYPTTAVAYIRSWATRNTTGPARLLTLLESSLLCRDSLV